MKTVHRLNLWLVSVAIACAPLVEQPVGQESSGNGDDTGDVVEEPFPGDDGPDEPDAPDEPDQPGTTSVSEESDGGSEAESGDPIDLGPCERLIGCATAAVVEVTPIVETYGENGTCWQEFEPVQCQVDCAAQLAALSDAYPDVIECRECEVDADCELWSDPPYCSVDGECCEHYGCVEPVCGNGTIDLGEQCDGEDLQGFDCPALGLGDGVLACDPAMCTFDTSGCSVAGGR